MDEIIQRHKIDFFSVSSTWLSRRSSTAAALIQCSGASDVMARFVDEDPAGILETVRRYMVKDVSAAMDAGDKAGVDLGALAAATATYIAK